MTDPTAVTTISHVRQSDAALVEVDLDERQAERAARGQSFGAYGEPRVFPAKDGIARAEAQLDQAREWRDDLVTAHPWLKSQPPPRDDDLPPAA